MTQSQAERRLVFFGTLLMVVAICTGLGMLHRPERMMLSAHTIGVTIATFTVAVGACVRFLSLGDRGRKWLVWTLLSSGYMNWFAALLGAVLGTNLFTPINGRGDAPIWAETLVGLILTAMVINTFVMLTILAKGVMGEARGVQQER
jgi:hypothetical protein